MLGNAISLTPGNNLLRAKGGGDAAPPGYGVLRIGSPSSNQLIRVGSDSSAPRILIATGA